jgi:hypothetical protein
MILRKKDKDYESEEQLQKPTEDRRVGESKKGFHRVEMYLLIISWIFIIILAYYLLREQSGAFYVVFISLITLLVGISIFWIVIKIPYDLYLEIDLTPDKTLDRYRMLAIPIHLRPDWDSKGSCYPLVNKDDGSYMYPCKKIVEDKKLIIYEHDARYTNSRWLVDKSSIIDIREENMRLRDEVFRLEYMTEETVQYRLALLLERLNIKRQLYKHDLQFTRDYNQNRAAYKDGRSRLSLLGDNPDDMDKPEAMAL